jgi:hypothetical protein
MAMPLVPGDTASFGIGRRLGPHDLPRTVASLVDICVPEQTRVLSVRKSNIDPGKVANDRDVVVDSNTQL